MDVKNISSTDLTFDVPGVRMRRPVRVVDHVEGGHIEAALVRVVGGMGVVVYGADTRLAGVTDEVDMADVVVRA